MAEQRPIDASEETDEMAGGTVLVDGHDTDREWFFNREVHDEAIHQGWRPFHVDGFRVVRGKGFPDLVMFRKNPETEQFEMLVAELKRHSGSPFGEGQTDWLEAFAQMGITTKVWRGDSDEDRRELYDIMENGTTGHDSVTKPLNEPSRSPVPANFGVVMDNTIESIEGNEMTTGEKASLRRMNPANPNSAAFWKLMSQRGIPRNADIHKWGLIMHGIALMAHSDGLAHNPRIRIGRALYEGDGSRMPFYSELRLSALLAARGDALHQILARLFRMLASQRCAFNWRDMAWFILNESHNEERADEARIEIARAYYRAQYVSYQANTENE